jgi:Cu2+-exporting ATPase
MSVVGRRCDHCGAEVGGVEVGGEGLAFCCTGCEAVYEALRGSGLEGYYALREVTGAEGSRPSSSGSVEASLWDAEAFRGRHGEACGDGTWRMELYLDGVHCAGCVWIVEKMPELLSGVLEARLDLPRARLSLRWDPSRRGLSEVASWLSRFGYAAHPLRGAGVKDRSEAERSLLLRAGVSWALAGNVMLLASALYAGLSAESEPALYAAAGWASLGLSALSVGYGGRTFLVRAWASLRAALLDRSGLMSLSMDVPISLGVLVGWWYSAWVVASGAAGELWFDSIAVLIAALLTSRWLQVRGRRRAGDAADRLLALLPGHARRVSAEGEIESVEVESLRVGDVIEVRAGELMPADGRVLSGVSTVHRGVLTGESRPEKVSVGDEVQAGTTNLGSVVRVEVEAAGAETRVGRLLEWIEARSQSRAPIVQWADRLSGGFVLAVVVASVLAGAAWLWQGTPSQAVGVVVALLVVACPCALGMATPLALTVAMGQAARRGIFIKHDDVIERFGDVTHVVLDKTGTLTEGLMSVLSVEGDVEAARAGALLEVHSQHPIAEALVRWSRGASGVFLEAQEVRELAGSGMRGEVGGAEVSIGRPEWVLAVAREEGGWGAVAARLASAGQTPLLVSVNREVKAAVGLGDEVRESSARLVLALQRRGIRPVLLSGDHPEVVSQVAARLGIAAEDAHGGVSPEEKRRFVEALSGGVGAVMMVGDGVNDAAALQAADIGVAVQGGAEVSLVAADIFTTRPGLDPVLELLEGAQEVRRVIRRSLVGSLVYNLAGVALAGFGWVGPLLAAVAMPLSSLSVVGSSLAQRSFVRREEGAVSSEGASRVGAKNAGVLASA